MLQPFQGTEGTIRPLGLTIDEAKAGAVQVIILQVVIPGTAVSASQHLLPACHGSDKREVVTPALPAQNSLGLGETHTSAELQPFPYLLSTFLQDGLLTLSTSARFCRLLLKGSRVRQETMTSRGWRQR